MIQDQFHQKIVQHRSSLEEWFRHKSTGLVFPFYSSFDIRDSGNIIAPVDANIFPAGFNNICQVDKENAVSLVKKYLNVHYSPHTHRVALLTEEHTSNLYYWNNVETLHRILSQAGWETKIAIPKKLDTPFSITNAEGKTLTIYGAEVINGRVIVQNQEMDLVICNNDFSEAYTDWVQGLKTPMNPPHSLGWHRRRKSSFFSHYNQLAQELAQVIDFPPHHIQVETTLFEDFDINQPESLDRLGSAVDQFLLKLKDKYAQMGIKQQPFVFIKNNAGTYGLAVAQVKSGEEVRSWNYKSRKKMKAAKGGKAVLEVIIQEGIPTHLVTENETAEPAIYMIGCHLAGGFLRSHNNKGPDENLNSPGAVFKRLCVSDLRISAQGALLENVYGWLAKLGFLAIAHEANEAKVEFLGYRSGCSL